MRVTLDQVLTQASTLLQGGKAEEAYALFMRLLREEPDHDIVNLGLVKAAVATNRIPQAIMALERLVDKYPSQLPLRRELARLYVSVGDVESAKAELERIEAYEPNFTRDKQEQILREFSRKPSSAVFAGRLSLGLIHDSNVNSGLGGARINLGDYSFILHDTATRKAAWGYYTNGALNGAWRLGADSPWWVTGDVGFHAKRYTDSVPSNQHFLWGRFGTGLRRIGSDTLFDLRIKLEQGIYDPHQKVTGLGPELLLAWSLGPKTQLITRAGLDKRTYSTELGRNGFYWWVGQFIRQAVGGSSSELPHELVLGARYTGADAKSRHYDASGWELSLRGLIRLPAKFELTPYVSWREDSYAGPASILEAFFGLPARKDQQFQTGTFLVYRWTERFSSEIGYQYVRNRSNSPLYDYNQHIINTGVTWTF